MSSKKKVATEVERTLSAEAVAALLEGIARGIRSNQVRLQGDETIDLHPGNLIKVKLEAKEKVEKGALTLKMTWQPPLMAGPASVLKSMRPTAATVVSGAGVDRASLDSDADERDEVDGKADAEEFEADSAPESPALKARPRRKAAPKKRVTTAKKGAVKSSRTRKKR